MRHARPRARRRPLAPPASKGASPLGRFARPLSPLFLGSLPTRLHFFPMAPKSRLLVRVLFLLPAALPAACSDATGPEEKNRLDLDRLFAPATPAEIAAVRAEWAGRAPTVQGFQIEATAAFPLAGTPGRLRIVSHLVDGYRHYGAIVVREGAAARTLPVIVYAHGGDAGVAVEELGLVFAALGNDSDDFVWVVPSFRSEALRYGAATYRSQGPPSPWDRDVDDALALMSAALNHEPAADPTRTAVVGFSRGGGVGLLMAVRDPRIRAVVEFFGPTDFFDPWVRGIVEEALRGQLRDLPGLPWLYETYIRPAQEGKLAVATVRKELVRRSAVLFAAHLPATQVHHGTADEVVSFSQAERLDRTMRGLGRSPPSYQFFSYPGGQHNPLTLPGCVERTAAFLARFAGGAT